MKILRKKGHQKTPTKIHKCIKHGICLTKILKKLDFSDFVYKSQNFAQGHHNFTQWRHLATLCAALHCSWSTKPCITTHVYIFMALFMAYLVQFSYKAEFRCRGMRATIHCVTAGWRESVVYSNSSVSYENVEVT